MNRNVESGPGDHYIKLGRQYKAIGNDKAAARFVACGQWINELWKELEKERVVKSNFRTKKTTRFRVV